MLNEINILDVFYLSSGIPCDLSPCSPLTGQAVPVGIVCVPEQALQPDCFHNRACLAVQSPSRGCGKLSHHPPGKLHVRTGVAHFTRQSSHNGSPDHFSTAQNPIEGLVLKQQQEILPVLPANLLPEQTSKSCCALLTYLQAPLFQRYYLHLRIGAETWMSWPNLSLEPGFLKQRCLDYCMCCMYVWNLRDFPG